MNKDFLEVVGDEDPVYLKAEDYKCSLGQKLKKSFTDKPMQFSTLADIENSVREFFNNAVLEENK